MVWDDKEPFIQASKAEDLINRWLFGLSGNPIKDVYVAGQQVIKQGQHALDQQTNEAFADLVRQYF